MLLLVLFMVVAVGIIPVKVGIIGVLIYAVVIELGASPGMGIYRLILSMGYSLFVLCVIL